MKLRTAYAQNIKDKDENKGWAVFSAEGERLAVLPIPCNEHTAMAAIHLARDAEKAGYKAGVKDGGDAMLAANRTKMIAMVEQIKWLEEANVRLSDKLMQFIEGE